LQFLSGLGLQENQAECHDVYGLDDELLEMVPKPVLAVLFLYPLTAKVIFSYKLHLCPSLSVYLFIDFLAVYSFFLSDFMGFYLLSV
jgi:hypothetical protein